MYFAPRDGHFCNLPILRINVIKNSGLPLILSIGKSGNIKWYFDAAFAVHKYMRSHNGDLMNMGTGGAYVHSSKQNMNTKSSTEAKLVGLDDVLTQVIRNQYFLK